MPAGRPTLYDPAYCDQVIAYMGEGFSLTAFAGEISVTPQTLHNWRADHAEFFDAVKIGQAKRVRKLETDLLSATEGPKVTSRIFALKNAGPEEWKDKIETKTTLAADESISGLFQRIAENGRRIHDPV